MLVWISDLGMKKGFPEITGNPICGAKGIRTPDPLHAMEMRYQLRHSPVELAGFERRPSACKADALPAAL